MQRPFNPDGDDDDDDEATRPIRTPIISSHLVPGNDCAGSTFGALAGSFLDVSCVIAVTCSFCSNAHY